MIDWLRRRVGRGMKITQKAVLFTVGMGGIIAETVYSLRYHQTPDSTLVLLFATMIGLPAFLSSKDDRDDDDHSRRRQDDDDAHSGDR